ncbi:hypothetical protein [Kribbella sp. NPDC003557]|uniref:hypothetical protein n=1 Tax=Kribbella sp. NPDC003557 TaxID=3154449 RepID=UPI0033A318DD
MLEALDAQRAEAFWTLDLEALDRVYVPGSQPWLSDRALLSEYLKRNVRVEGLQITIDSIAITRRTSTTVTLKAIDHLAAGQVIDGNGTKTPLPRGVPTTRLITLIPSPRRPAQQSPVPSRSSDRQPSSGWRIGTITQP